MSKGAQPQQDYGGMFTAMALMQQANQQYQLGSEQLNWAKDVYNQNQPMIQGSAEQDLSAQKNANDFSQNQQQFYENTYQPLQQKYVDQVQNWDTPAQEEQNAGLAEANVNEQFTQARNAASQQLESFGVDPSSTRYASLDIGTRTQQAAAAAGQGTQAAINTKLQGLGLEAGAISQGQGLPNQSAALSGAGTGAGSAASSGLTNYYGTGAQAQNGANVWYNSGNSAMLGAGNLFNNAYSAYNKAQAQYQSRVP